MGSWRDRWNREWEQLSAKGRETQTPALSVDAERYGWAYSACERNPRAWEKWAIPAVPKAKWRTSVVWGRVAGLKFIAFKCEYKMQGRVMSVSMLREMFLRLDPITYAVLVLPLPNRVPLLDVFPADWHDRPAESLGVTPSPELESSEFNARFQIFSRTPRFAVDVLTPRLMERMLASDALAWRFEERTLTVRWPDKAILTGRLLRERLEEVAEARADIPQRVFKEWSLGA